MSLPRVVVDIRNILEDLTGTAEKEFLIGSGYTVLIASYLNISILFLQLMIRLTL